MVDGGGGGGSKKKFSDFAQNFFIISSEKIKLFVFWEICEKLFYRKKIRLQLSKSGVFC